MRTHELNLPRQVAAGLNNMNSKRFAKRMKDSGVSPVIATILMVAITVVLAAVLYVMVSGFTHSPGTANSAGLNEAQVSSTQWNVTIASVSASNIPLTNLKIVISGGNTTLDGTYLMPSGTITPGGAPVKMGTTNYVEFGAISGNSATYLSSGDYFLINGGSMSGATITLYNGNSNLGSVSL